MRAVDKILLELLSYALEKDCGKFEDVKSRMKEQKIETNADEFLTIFATAAHTVIRERFDDAPSEVKMVLYDFVADLAAYSCSKLMHKDEKECDKCKH